MRRFSLLEGTAGDIRAQLKILLCCRMLDRFLDPGGGLGDISHDPVVISAIVLVPGGPLRDDAREGEMLVRSLVWLVSAVVSGVVRDVTLAGPSGLELAEIADQSGCAATEDDDEAGRLAKAMISSKQPRLLILKSGFQPGDSMTGELDSLARAMASGEAAKLLAAPASFWPRVFPGLAQTAGLLAPASRCRDLAGRDFAGLKAGLSPRITFATRAVPIL